MLATALLINTQVKKRTKWDQFHFVLFYYPGWLADLLLLAIISQGSHYFSTSSTCADPVDALR